MNSFSGYIEINLGGEQIPFKFGSNAFALFCQKHELEFWEIYSSGVFGHVDEKGKVTKAPDLPKLYDLFYYAHHAAMLSEGKGDMINRYKLGDYLDEDPEVIFSLQKAVTSAKFMGRKLDEKVEEQSKKK